MLGKDNQEGQEEGVVMAGYADYCVVCDDSLKHGDDEFLCRHCAKDWKCRSIVKHKPEEWKSGELHFVVSFKKKK